jgi:uncharacterized membrane protein SpoIIM required for sporulation
VCYGSGALLIGLLAGAVSTFGFAVVMPYLSQNYDLQVRRSTSSPSIFTQLFAREAQYTTPVSLNRCPRT